jgi:hypothetical protein
MPKAAKSQSASHMVHCPHCTPYTGRKVTAETARRHAAQLGREDLFNGLRRSGAIPAVHGPSGRRPARRSRTSSPVPSTSGGDAPAAEDVSMDDGLSAHGSVAPEREDDPAVPDAEDDIWEAVYAALAEAAAHQPRPPGECPSESGEPEDEEQEEDEGPAVESDEDDADENAFWDDVLEAELAAAMDRDGALLPSLLHVHLPNTISNTFYRTHPLCLRAGDYQEHVLETATQRDPPVV